MRRLLIFGLLALAFSGACTPLSPTQSSSSVDANSVGSALDWDRSPEAVVVRLDTTGSTGDPVYDRNTLPFCTLFGDGHLMWVDPYADPEQVLEDRLSEPAVREFLEFIIGTGFYSWDPTNGILLPVTQEPNEPGPIVERISVTLFGQTVEQTALSNWPSEAFATILDRCQHLSSTPALFIPSGAWLSAVPAEMRSDIPSLPWNMFAQSFPDLDLTAISLENPRWVTGDLARVMWEIVREGRMQITRDGIAYRMVVQVPGLQPTAPAAPTQTAPASAGS